MARTVIISQPLQTQPGQQINFQPVDGVNGMQVKNTGIQVVLVQTLAGGAVTVSFPTQPDTFGRTAPIPIGSQGVPQVVAYGPFTQPQIWGDGIVNLFIDFSGISGSPQIAVITI